MFFFLIYIYIYIYIYIIYIICRCLHFLWNSTSSAVSTRWLSRSKELLEMSMSWWLRRQLLWEGATQCQWSVVILCNWSSALSIYQSRSFKFIYWFYVCNIFLVWISLVSNLKLYHTESGRYELGFQFFYMHRMSLTDGVSLLIIVLSLVLASGPMQV